MSMHVCGQTLVLVDNDATVSAVNRKIVKATLKYMFYHMPEDRAIFFIQKHTVLIYKMTSKWMMIVFVCPPA